MGRRVPPGEPRSRDLSRLVLARAFSRLAVARAGEAFADARLSAFRAEIGRSVRRASPFMMALLDHEGIRLDALAWEIWPAEGWPEVPKVPAGRQVADILSRAAGSDASDADAIRCAMRLPGVDLLGSLGDFLRIHVVDHSLETIGRIGRLSFASLFGSVNAGLALRRGEAVPDGAAAREFGDVVGHPAFDGRRWPLTAFRAEPASRDVRFAARTGSIRFVMPWARPANSGG